METILQSIMDVPGVGAALVVEGNGQLVCHRGHSIYDRGLCEQLASALAKAVDAVQLQQSDWESVSAQFADGKLLLRNLGRAGAERILAVVADATLNPSFATVAIRVAANKLKKGGSGTGSSVLSGTPPPVPSGSVTQPPPGDSRPVLANTGLTWSSSSSGSGSSSSIGLSRVAVADPGSGAFLGRCAKELARHVGPMAKVYVEEAVRRVSPDAPFALAAAARLVDDLAGQIEDPDDRKLFQKAVEKH